MKSSISLIVAGILVTALQAGAAQDLSFNGSVELEQRNFLEGSSSTGYSNSQTSIRLKLEWSKDWNDGSDLFVLKTFYRFDNRDDERQHGDIHELIWNHFGSNWESSIGIGQVFRGVTESQHLVDIINQTDTAESVDGEDKLGQPMIRYSYFNDWGTFDGYLLPYFRPRTFPGEGSRLTGGILVKPDQEVYQSGAKQKHLDLALQWNHTVGNWGMGVSWFHGTSREPDLTRFFDPDTLSTRAYYPQISQFGADVQLTTDAWLIKFEGIWRQYKRDDTNQQLDDFTAATFGAEYTFVGIFGTQYDLGVLAEYSRVDRGERNYSFFQNDLFYGARFSLNDIGSSTMLFGILQDLDNIDHIALFVEGNTSIGNGIVANIEIRYFDADDPIDPLFLFRNNSFVQVGIEWFF